MLAPDTAALVAYRLPCTLESLELCERQTNVATKRAAETGSSDDWAFAQGCLEIELAVVNRLEALRLFQEAFAP